VIEAVEEELEGEETVVEELEGEETVVEELEGEETVVVETVVVETVVEIEEGRVVARYRPIHPVICEINKIDLTITVIIIKSKNGNQAYDDLVQKKSS